MAKFLIEQRAPGDPTSRALAWDVVATVDAPDGPTAIHLYCQHMQWWTAQLDHNLALVHGVGHFRSVPAPESTATRSFVIQRQDEMGPDDTHLSWSDVASVPAADAASAIRAWCDRMGWSHVPVHDSVAQVTGYGNVRAVPAEGADAARITPGPTDSAW